MDKIKRLLQRFKKDANVRIQRRKALVALLSHQSPLLKLALFFVGYVWMVVIPSSQLGRGTYIDENALQPGQVTTYWDWADVHSADVYLNQLESLRDANATSEQRGQFLMTEFSKLGVSSSTQAYTFTANTGMIKGTNAYAILSSPRASGTEAMVISASWLSLIGGGDGTLNLRGVATVLALAKFLRRYSLWAKDVVFVISDGYLDGMHAWLSAYHGTFQSNLEAEQLSLSSGVIWTALNLDYPGHSFSHLGIFFEGLNGRLPNQDLLNSFQRISRYTGGVPVMVYDHLDPREYPGQSNLDNIPSWIPNSIRQTSEVQTYAYQAANILRHVGYQARGRASGVHGLLHQFRIDAITLYAVPANGPHGFHAIGRIVESTLRTTNNLLERLHASFFFYILTSSETFLKIGSYLPSVVLISVAMMFGGLSLWVSAAWVRDTVEEHDQKTVPSEEKWIERKRPVLTVLGIMFATHALGALSFFVITRGWFIANRMMLSPILFTIIAILPFTSLFVSPLETTKIAPLSTLLNALNLCLASTVISTTTVLNFSLAATLAVLLGIPLSISPSFHLATRLIKFAAYTLYVFLGFGWMIFLDEEMIRAIWDWEILAVWFAPFVCIVYAPLALQAGIAILLP